LGNRDFLGTLTNGITGDLFSGSRVLLEIIGRFLVLLVFNEALINLISSAVSGRAVKTLKAHLAVFFVSLGIAVSPYIANMGSMAWLNSLPGITRLAAVIVSTIFSQAGLWAEVYLLTGIILDGTHSIKPSGETISGHLITGLRKGMVYSGVFMAFIYLASMFFGLDMIQSAMAHYPVPLGILLGAFTFPLMKTIIETFDGSQAFFGRVKFNYRDAALYARGAAAGWGLSWGIANGFIQKDMSARIPLGLFTGLAASAGVSILRDSVYLFRKSGRVQSWRLYLIDALLGGFVGSALAFYLDSSQVPVILEKFKLYTGAGFSPRLYTTYPLINKWGRIDLGSYTGGVKLFFDEALAGVINWSVAAWLFAINRAFVEAFFQKDKAPVRFLFSRDGFVDLMKHMVQVLRWGLWMAPIINTGLRMMPEPTWYNQDGAVRTLFAVYQNIAANPAGFQAWSLKIFTYVLAFDLFRILIWIDHMGLRVATLVNLSFIGMNRLDEKMARFIGPAAAQRYIPEAVKRFTTWAPLLIPFYIPRDTAWNHAWSSALAIQNSPGRMSIFSVFGSLTLFRIIFLACAALLVFSAVFFLFLSLARKKKMMSRQTFEISNRNYRITLKDNGEIFSHVQDKGFDLTRRSYDTLDP
ncbi:MAG TPA: hypothetical protein VJC03_00625, partial [bacterium]|nr:hypothetical protein [bacterium]